MKMGPKGWNGNYGKWPNYIVWLIGIINGEKWGNEMLIEYPLCIYFLFRYNCFWLSVEDSRDCCRQWMMIRQTETNQWNVSWNLTGDRIH